jgi:hypothetical protein
MKCRKLTNKKKTRTKKTKHVSRKKNTGEKIKFEDFDMKELELSEEDGLILDRILQEDERDLINENYEIFVKEENSKDYNIKNHN